MCSVARDAALQPGEPREAQAHLRGARAAAARGAVCRDHGRRQGAVRRRRAGRDQHAARVFRRGRAQDAGRCRTDRGVGQREPQDVPPREVLRGLRGPG